MVAAQDRRVGSVPLSPKELPFADHSCIQAFQTYEDKCCVPKEISASLDLESTLVANEMPDVEIFLDKSITWASTNGTCRTVIK